MPQTAMNIAVIRDGENARIIPISLPLERTHRSEGVRCLLVWLVTYARRHVLFVERLEDGRALREAHERQVPYFGTGPWDNPTRQE